MMKPTCSPEGFLRGFVFWLLFPLIVSGCALLGRQPATPVPEPRWWKGCLHVHTLWSDGKALPEDVADWYKSHGYHFLAPTDHDILQDNFHEWRSVSKLTTGTLERYRARWGNDWVETSGTLKNLQVRLKPLEEYRALFDEKDRFLLLPGEEISDAFALHLNAINLSRRIEPQKGRITRGILQDDVDAVRAQQQETSRTLMVTVNHPNWFFSVSAEKLIALHNLQFFEVYNGVVNNVGDTQNPTTDRIWDIVLTKRIAEQGQGPLYGLASDDAHVFPPYPPEFNTPEKRAQAAQAGRGWVMVRAQHLTPESILRAMARGDFYASTGVELRDVRFDGRTLHVEVSPTRGVDYTIQFLGTRKGYDPKGTPILDKDGKETRYTWIYGPEIGTVLREVHGTRASYTLREEDIYVRAKVTSTRVKSNPQRPGEREEAWTQPWTLWNRKEPGTP